MVFIRVNEKTNPSISVGKAEKHKILGSLESIKLAKCLRIKITDMENNIKITCFTEMKTFKLNEEQEVNLENFTFIYFQIVFSTFDFK